MSTTVVVSISVVDLLALMKTCSELTNQIIDLVPASEAQIEEVVTLRSLAAELSRQCGRLLLGKPRLIGTASSVRDEMLG